METQEFKAEQGALFIPNQESADVYKEFGSNVLNLKDVGAEPSLELLALLEVGRGALVGIQKMIGYFGSNKKGR